MKSRLLTAVLLVVCATVFAADAPLRIFIRAGRKTHGPPSNGQHDGPTFLKDWKQLLTDRGAKVDGTIAFPTAEQLENTDVIVFYTEEGGRIKPDDRANLDKFLKRGGGIVAIHDSVCGNDAQWWKTIIGGAWEHGYSKWLEHDVPIYYTSVENPITAGASNFEFDDEIYYDLHMMPEAKILAGSWTPDRRNAKGGRLLQHIYDVCPQMWTYEKDNYRAFVSIPGHHYKSFNLPHFRSVLLRGIAWAGKRDANLFTDPKELASLRYPEGGPTAPENAAKKLDLHPDFDIRLVASEPLINKVINIDWDPAGRMWVAETPEYPNGRRGIRNDQAGVEWKDHGGLVAQAGKQDRPAHDRISKLIDSNGDGIADRKEIFYEGLELVTSFVFYRDGVIVSQAPDILWLRDTNGDGKADKVEKLYVGLGTNDTHAVINNLRWGFDGWIYATHGYSAGTVTSPDGAKNFGRINSGVVRFKPDGSGFEQYCSKNGNTWGLEVTSDDEILFTQPTSGDLLNHVVMSEAVLGRGKVGNTASFKPVIRGRKSNPVIKHENLAYVQIDLVGYFTAAAGCAIYEGGAWPSDWTYSYFTTEPTINIAHHEVVKTDGPTFTANKTREEEFIGGRDPWFRPIETRVGPDGALYVVDFYNQAVIHNDTRGPKHNGVNAAVRPDRDHYFGRIWRVHHKQSTPVPVPNLTEANANNLVAALESPSKPVRFTAHRLLWENPTPEVIAALQKIPMTMEAPAWLHRIWLMADAGQLPDFILTEALKDERAAIRKNALRVAALRTTPEPNTRVKQAMLLNLRDSDARVQLEAIVALGSLPVDDATAKALVKMYPSFTNAWAESAVAGVAARNPSAFLNAALSSETPDDLRGLVTVLVEQAATKAETNSEIASALVFSAANAPAKADALKAGIFETLAKSLKPQFAPKWSDPLRDTFQSVLKANNPVVSASSLSLISRWDQQGTMKNDVQALIPQLLTAVNHDRQPDDRRAQLAVSLLGVRESNSEIVPTVAKLIGSSASPLLQKRVIDALGSSADPAIGAAFADLYPKLSPEMQETVFAQIVKRRDWSLALVESLQQGKIQLASLNPSAVHRLRTHSDGAVARRANDVIDALRGPEAKEKEALISKLALEMEKPGNLENGRKTFTQNCAVCHRFNGEGKELAPDLTDMGVHGAHELLVHILDPNRMVEENYMSVSIETKDGESYDGILGRDTRASVLVRNANGDTEIKTADIKSRRMTGRSLMPEGFEALGAETLRDMLGYMIGGDSKYRVIDMKSAFTADTRKGLFQREENPQDTLEFKKFGVLKVGDVPFDVVNPTRSRTGNNIIVLKGGSGVARRMPQKTEITNINTKASRLHFLGGVGGWMYPYGGERTKDLPAAKVTVEYADGQREEFVLKNGVEFADWNGQAEVPGSKIVSGAVTHGQVRTFVHDLARGGVIQSITLQSFDNSVAPVFVAITAEAGSTRAKLADASAAAGVASDALPEKPFTWGAGTKVLLVGGGSSHDYQKFFNRADTATLKAAGFSVNYTEDGAVTARELPKVDVVILSVNAPKWATPDLRKALFDFVAAGKGVVLLHPGMWYNFNDWPEFNRVLAGGGSRGHDSLGEFTVNVVNKEHPITRGVTASFKITDELYYMTPDTNGTPIEVLAETSPSKKFQKPHPSVFVVKHPQARIAGIALGHDARAHDLPEYQKLLVNAANWAAGK
jgi:putative membrane-bound dehydrogenase-like protein